jgi:hypothetical protein
VLYEQPPSTKLCLHSKSPSAVLLTCLVCCFAALFVHDVQPISVVIAAVELPASTSMCDQSVTCVSALSAPGAMWCSPTATATEQMACAAVAPQNADHLQYTVIFYIVWWLVFDAGSGRHNSPAYDAAFSS